MAESELLRDAFIREGTTLHCRKGQVIFSQGNPADGVFLIREGQVKLSVVSTESREAAIGILAVGDLIGEDALAQAQTVRRATASAFTECAVARMARPAALRLLRDDHTFTRLVLGHVLARKARIEEDLVDQLCHSSEKRLARVLLLLSQSAGKDGAEGSIPDISQETLAELVGTTRSRVSFFMNKFRKLGLIDYRDGIRVHKSLGDTFTRDEP
ncbi:MAG: Crp/Fnr family transcriptional regulator [Bryobacteraceae bacterium]